MAPPTVEEMAAVSRAKLRPCMRVTSELLRAERTPSGALLARMNDVLGAVVDSNFGAATHGELTRLYATIARLQPDMLGSCENLAMLYFARSLAVVMEEAVRQREERLAFERSMEEAWRQREEERLAFERGMEEAFRQQEERLAEWSKDEAVREEVERLAGSKEPEAPEENSEEYGIDKEERREEEEYGSQRAYGIEEMMEEGYRMQRGRSEDCGSVEVGDCSTASPSPPLSPQLPQETAETVSEWARLPEGLLTEFSEAQRTGVLTINGVSPHIGKEQLAPFLEMMGPVAELRHYPNWSGWQTGLAVCRYENEESANEAMARLNHKIFFGTKLYIRKLPRARPASSASVADDNATRAGGYFAESPPPPPTPSPTDTDATPASVADDYAAQAGGYFAASPPPPPAPSPTDTDASSASVADDDAARAGGYFASSPPTPLPAPSPTDTDTVIGDADSVGWGSMDEVD